MDYDCILDSFDIHNALDKAALGAPTEGTVSRRRSGNVDP